jgi:hypothetical protein
MTNETPLYIIKSDGNKELFDPSKLKESLQNSGAPSDVINEISDHISSEIEDGMTTREIYKHAFEILHKKAQPVALKYSLRHAVMELGPSGFPFEDYVAEIFRARGFEAKTGQVVKGFCIPHEIDVVAWNDEKLIMVEAKFHNELGMKSDVKVVLYIKARFDDLRRVKFNYGKEREIDEAWLVTNTKFTSTAIEYGSCQGTIRMIGWNYPPVGNLQDMIMESKLHPITCLGSLNGREKKELMQKGVVLCKTIKENPDFLDNIGVKAEQKVAVLEEIGML